jgi:LuxR family transcriptional regulator, maltose regulon positive regulatory protein
LQRTHEIAQNTKVDLIVAQVAALRARLQLIKGDLETATTWAANSGLDPDDEEANHPGWREVEYLTLARVLCAQGRFPEALSLLDRLLRSAQSEERDGTSIAILATQALVYQAQGNKIRALGYLERALTRAEPEGYIRIFIDEGDPMIFLLTEFRNHHREIIRNVDGNTSSRLMAYVDTLLAAFSDTQISVRTQSAVHTEQVSSRELQVLHLIEIGLTNQEIAERLVIALSTVKSHINSLYSKVGASNRVQAIALAREQGLLSER